MHRFILFCALSLAVCCTSSTRAQDEKSLTRDEVSVIKKKMVAVLDALGQPAGYSLEHDNFNLPT